MRDRTLELGAKLDSHIEDEEKKRILSPGDGKASSKDEQVYFENVQQIRKNLGTLSQKIDELERKQLTVLGVALPEESMKRELQTLREEIKNIANVVKKNLKSIEPKPEEEDSQEYIPVNKRMQKTQHGVLSREFVELMGKCNTIQSQYRDRNIERIQRQLKITGTNVSDEQLDEMLETGQTDIFTQNILKDTQATKQALNEIESRHDEILKLERSIRELHELFQYLAMEVEAQGEVIDRIEDNILQSKNYVEKAADHMQSAVENKHKACKKKICIAVCLSVVLLIIIIAIVTAVFAK
ncbi:syntaxin-4 [Erpetoichthys calabaricus]|uniref:Syntaxin 4 n=1 Tax=Erpetoichthys calabaricus TaxID=27687 RepID=A0A8C4TBC9_ERPCA|nr:syntaxin-4 [Erpetoichthys calabaricus]